MVTKSVSLDVGNYGKIHSNEGCKSREVSADWKNEPGGPGRELGGYMKDLFTSLTIRISALWRREDGQTMAEYGIILVVVAVVAAAAFVTLGSDVSGAIGKVSAKLTSVP
jgi:Flp pilus assembly pilin Flp